MLGYRKRSFYHVHRLLRNVVDSPDDLSSLIECQQELCAEILHAESKVTHLQRNRKSVVSNLKTQRPPRTLAEQLKSRIKWIDKRIKSYRQLAFLWRCFGDAIAFSYLDSFSLKQVFYEIPSVRMKQAAGSLSGKEGLKNEFGALQEVIGRGIPALLTDLTNSIRYGDICVLIGPDPYLIEVKSSPSFSSRGKRQIVDIEAIHTFLENDEATGLRGLSRMSRVPLPKGNAYYSDIMRGCIHRARERGIGSAKPEEGLIYMAIRGRNPDLAKFSFMPPLRDGRFFFLNDFKNKGEWAPYTPFTLSIEGADDLYDFFRGDLILCVIFDFEVFRDLLREKGFTPIEDDDDYLRFSDSDNTDNIGGIAWHLLHRIGFEFISPAFLVEHVARRSEDLAAILGSRISPE